MKALGHFSLTFFFVLVSIPIFALQQYRPVPAVSRIAAGPHTPITERKDEFKMKSISEKLGLNIDEVSSPLVVRPEHVAFNVPDPQASVKWYVENLGMKVMRSSGPPTYMTFIVDSGNHMMIELTRNADYPVLESPKIHHMSLHLAFMVGDLAAMKKSLLAAGATMIEDIAKTPSGDLELMLRDPWGLSIQFVQRVKPMLQATGVRPEHLALNVKDSRARAKWFVTNLGMKIVREGGAPMFKTFVSDLGGKMMLELYQDAKYPVIDFKKVTPMSIHLASMVPDVAAAKDVLLAAKSTVVEDITKTLGGDDVLMMKDPWGFPIQFVKRVDPMLK
ncbi:MAG: VOC family protein [Ignavibacteriales bacterium]|nr:VOC family protein [Ignavibacteriales bacterium]